MLGEGIISRATSTHHLLLLFLFVWPFVTSVTVLLFLIVGSLQDIQQLDFLMFWGLDCVKRIWGMMTCKQSINNISEMEQSVWSRGLMDKALASGAGDCGFESHRDRKLFD